MPFNLCVPFPPLPSPPLPSPPLPSLPPPLPLLSSPRCLYIHCPKHAHLRCPPARPAPAHQEAVLMDTPPATAPAHTSCVHHSGNALDFCNFEPLQFHQFTSSACYFGQYIICRHLTQHPYPVCMHRHTYMHTNRCIYNKISITALWSLPVRGRGQPCDE